MKNHGYRAALLKLLSNDVLRLQALAAVQSLALPDCWIGAGFVRNAVWDYLHGYPEGRLPEDVDVVWFDAEMLDASMDLETERQLQLLMPGVNWSVKNQARMHRRNGDPSYQSVADAMCHWPETATAVAVRSTIKGNIEINAPFGLDDLFGLQLRPTQAFEMEKMHIFERRISSKRWIERYPLLKVI